jgi:hypothetical protein
MRIAPRHSKTGAVPASTSPKHADHDDDDLRRLSERREVRMTSIR